MQVNILIMPLTMPNAQWKTAHQLVLLDWPYPQVKSWNTGRHYMASKQMFQELYSQFAIVFYLSSAHTLLFFSFNCIMPQ